MIDTNTKQVDIANMLEVPKQAITKIFNKKNLTCDDMQKLLSLMGYELRIDFVPVEQSGKQMCVWYGKNYDGIVFDIWYVFTTLGMFLGVILG